MLRPDDAQALHASCYHSTHKWTYDHIMGRAGDALVAPAMPSKVCGVCHEYNEISPRHTALRMCRSAA